MFRDYDYYFALGAIFLASGIPSGLSIMFAGVFFIVAYLAWRDE